MLPVGWETTHAGAGRPQSRINEQLRTCDYFVLVLHDRWGSSPSPPGTNGFSSGSEEEFDVAGACLKGDEPMRDIMVLFKGVNAQQLSDPGPQLSQVLEFKAKLEREKTLMYATFDTIDEFRRQLQRHLLRWLRETTDADQLTTPAKAPTASSRPRRPVRRAKSASPVESVTEQRLAEAVAEGADAKTLAEYARFLRRNGRLAYSDEMSLRLLKLGEEADDVAAQVQAYANLGVSKRKQGEVNDAEAYLRKGIDIGSGSPTVPEADLAYLYNNLGLTLRRRGDFSGASDNYSTAIEIYERLEDRKGLAHAYNNLSFVSRERGDLKLACNKAKAALEAARAGGDDDSTATALCNLGLALADMNQHAEAIAAVTESLKLHEKRVNLDGMGTACAHLARITLDSGGDIEAARTLAGRAQDLSDRANNNQEGLAMSLHVIGNIAFQKRELEKAEDYLSDAHDIYQALGHTLGVVGTSADLARTYAATQRFDQARQMLGEADAVLSSLDHAGLREKVQAAHLEVDERSAGARTRRPGSKKRRGQD